MCTYVHFCTLCCCVQLPYLSVCVCVCVWFIVCVCVCVNVCVCVCVCVSDLPPWLMKTPLFHAEVTKRPFISKLECYGWLCLCEADTLPHTHTLPSTHTHSHTH